MNVSQVSAAQDGLSKECLLNTYLKESHAKNAQGKCLAPKKHDDGFRGYYREALVSGGGWDVENRGRGECRMTGV